jgi:hypothetical protein
MRYHNRQILRHAPARSRRSNAAIQARAAASPGPVVHTVCLHVEFGVAEGGERGRVEAAALVEILDDEQNE